MQEEAFFEYHLYTLPRPTTLERNQTKQVELLDAPKVAFGKQHELRGGGGYYRGPWPGRPPRGGDPALGAVLPPGAAKRLLDEERGDR